MSVNGWFYHLWFLYTKYVCIHQCLWEGGFGLLLNLCVVSNAVCLDRWVFFSQLALHHFSLAYIKNFFHFFFFFFIVLLLFIFLTWSFVFMSSQMPLQEDNGNIVTQPVPRISTRPPQCYHSKSSYLHISMRWSRDGDPLTIASFPLELCFTLCTDVIKAQIPNTSEQACASVIF